MKKHVYNLLNGSFDSHNSFYIRFKQAYLWNLQLHCLN